MPGFIENAATGAFEATMDRVVQKLDYGYENQRPTIDPKQQAEFLAEHGGGKTDERFHQALGYHGFVWWTVDRLALLPGPLKTEGEWRNDRMKLAYTPNDLTTGWPAGPEAFDRFIREEKLKRQATKGKVSKQDLQRARQRR